ncbi:MAG TPA: hypothetical protein VFZ49_06695 [Pyrinomonadaceae bacterium]
MNVYTVFAAIPIVLVLFTGGGFAQSKRCDGFDEKVTYRILVDNITTKESRKRLSLHIYIKPERFTVDSMVKLVERIRTEYCEFDSIAVFVFDTKKREKLPDPPPHPLFELPSENPPRGFYKFDKQANTAELTFQEKRNSKVIDVEIVFRSDGYCVSEMPTQPSEHK